MANVTLKSGEVFSCDCEPILDAALAQGIPLEYSCKRGDCDACECVLLSGQVRQQEEVLSSGDLIKTCQAIPLSDCGVSANYVPELNGVKKIVSPAKVDSISINASTAQIKLRLPPSTTFKFLEGQYLNLIYLGVKRSYSIASTNDSGLIELHIKKVDGGKMSQLIFPGLSKGTLMRIEGPLGSFFVRKSDRPIVFLATGTGFAPVQSMVRALIRDGVRRPIKVYWGNRSEQDFYTQAPENEFLAYEGLEYQKVLSQDCGTRKARYVQEAAIEDINDFSGVDAYACGSIAMIESAKSALLARGLSPDRYYSDAFVATTD